MRRRRSHDGMSIARATAAAKPRSSYGLMIRASSSSCAAPASSLRISTPSKSSRAATNAFPFILCPRGRAQDATARKYDTPSSEWIEHDVEGALVALRARFGRYVADGPLLFAGFSLGAAHGMAVVVHRPAMYPAALFIEGGYSLMSPALALSYAKGGGRRVMLGCGQANCPARFASAAASLRAAGIEVRILDAHTGRHNLDGEMMQERPVMVLS